MLSDLLYFAIAFFYKTRGVKEGMRHLLNQTPYNELPEEFKSWWLLHRDDLLNMTSQWVAKNIKITYPGCWDYPRIFLDKLENAPILLFYKGEPVWIKSNCISVVGSRKISNHSKRWLESELFTYLRQSRDVLVSGGAIGIDQEAHLQSLRLNLPTIVILPSGLLKFYPKVLSDWEKAVIENGGVFLSEYLPEQEMRTFHFIQRNRLIAALASSVLIVQGEKRSGTLLTAKLALDLGQTLGVVPGHPMDMQFSGNHEVMRWGAIPIMDSRDLLVLNYKIGLN